MAWKVEVIADNSGKWCSNMLRWADKDRKLAEAYGAGLFMRWTAVREWRVTECDDPVTEEGEAAA